jgi:hypothetical protein
MLKIESHCVWNHEEVRRSVGWFKTELTGEVKRKLTAYGRTDWKWFVDVSEVMWQDYQRRHLTEPVFLGDIRSPGDPLFLRVFAYRDDIWVTKEDMDEAAVRGYWKKKEATKKMRIDRLRTLGNE